MATSMRLLLSPRLSTISPKSPLKVKSPVTRKSKARKQLQYSIQIPQRSTEVTIKSPNVQISLSHIASPQSAEENVSLILNTPNREKILEIGLPQPQHLVILGRGSFGTVVRCVYKGNDVAAKVIRSGKPPNELNALHLRHENIVHTIDVIRKNSSHSIIIMEYLADANHLQSLIDNEQYQLSLNIAIKCLIGIANGLNYCHSNHLLHMDLKPRNILVIHNSVNNPICKLCDFGNSQFIHKNSTISINNHNFRGTVQYTAPEVLQGNVPEFTSDIYSLGIIMWQLRYRETPYECLETCETIIYNARTVVKFHFRPPMAAILDEIHDGFSDLYHQCWHEVSDQRPTLHSITTQLMHLQTCSL